MAYCAKDLKQAGVELGETFKNWRREFHQHPELGFQEVWTTARIKEILNKIGGIRIWDIPCKTGVVAEMQGSKPDSGTIGLRCDIDALPILEQNTHEFVSKTPGLMHGCGHDGHITILLGAALMLSKFKPEKNVRFLFQPAEETTPDGAPDFLACHALDGLESIWGFHINATSDFGNIGYYDGTVMSGGAGFKVAVHGKSGHPSYPEACINPVQILSKIALEIDWLKNTVRATRPYAITFCSLNSGTDNGTATPAYGELTGRISFLENDLYTYLKKRIPDIANAACGLYGAKAEVTFVDHLPLTYNTPALGERVRRNAKLFGYPMEEIFPSMGSDDFGYYANVIPGYYMTFGIRTGADFPIAHTPKFNFDEKIFESAVPMFVSCALDIE